MIDYPENIAPTGAFQEKYCYNEIKEDRGFYYGGPNGYQPSGFEGSRRGDIYRTDVTYENGRTENPFDPRPSDREVGRNYWDEAHSGVQYQNSYVNDYFQATQLDRRREEPFDIPSRRQDTLNGTSFESFGYRNDSYDAQNEYTPQPKMTNGYSYNNPYAEAAMASNSSFGTVISGFGGSTTDNWSNQYVTERPMPPQGNPWRHAYDPYDNRREAFESSLQPSIPETKEDPFADWVGYAEKNWPRK